MHPAADGVTHWWPLGCAVVRCVLGKFVQFGGDVRTFGGAKLLEDRQRLPQVSFTLGGAAAGHGTVTEAEQRMCLIPGTVDAARHTQGSLVGTLGERTFTGYQVKDSNLVERLGLASRAPDLPVDVKCLFQSLSGGREVTSKPQCSAEVA
jgi:hypothetical protein